MFRVEAPVPLASKEERGGRGGGERLLARQATFDISAEKKNRGGGRLSSNANNGLKNSSFITAPIKRDLQKGEGEI